MNLHSQLSDIADRESYIAEKLGITIEEARNAIKTSSFGEYRAMVEANADHGFVGTQTTQSSVSTPNTANTMRTPDVPVSANSGNTTDSKEFDDALVQLNDPTRKSELERIKRTQETNPAQAEKDYESFKQRNPELTTASGNKPSAFDKMFAGTKAGKSEFMRGFNNNIREDAELARLRELAGIQETATSGGVAAANIATSASIIGDTSDSHKPSVQLRKDNRLDREDKEQQDVKQNKQDAADKETNSNIERLIKR
jgi:hypothetical protein